MIFRGITLLSALLPTAGLLFLSAPVAAAPRDLFISEYVEGTSNNKAIEIYNGTGTAVDMVAGNYNVQMFFNGGSSAGLTINLLGTIASGEVFVLAHALAEPALLARAQQTNASSWFNGDDVIVLRKGSAVLDVIGQIGVDPGAQWGTGLTSTADNTLARAETICSGDVNGEDVFVPESQWQGAPVDSWAGLGSHTAACTSENNLPFVVASIPAQGESAALDSNISVTFSEPVAVSSTWFTLVCSLTGAHAATVSGGPLTFVVDPSARFVSGESCRFTVDAKEVSDLDATPAPNSMASNLDLVFTPFDACMQPVTPIYEIQGRGPDAAITGSVSTRGIVVGDFEGPAPALRGFYLQDASGDGDATTSDGIFVFHHDNDLVHLGDVVHVRGSASEFQGQTQISAAAVSICGKGTVSPVDVTLPFTSADDLERFEGMLVRLPQTLTVTEHFQLGRFGQVVVSSGGRLRQPTNDVAPGAPALALQAANNLNRIIIDDATNAQNPGVIVFGREENPLSESNTIRGGDTVTGTVGVMTYTWAGNAASGNTFRVRPVGALQGRVRFVPSNPRPSGPPFVGGHVQVVGMNLLNFFNTWDGLPDRTDNCRGGVGGLAMDCRGADDETEFARQVAKTVAAILSLDPDVLAVNEIENDGYGPQSAIATLVAELNARAGAGSYAFIEVDAEVAQENALGTDAIKVGLLYKPAVVTPIGQTAVLATEAFVNGGDSGPRGRASLAQAFSVNINGQVFIANVNHFKSKGSECDSPDAGDGQGNCNQVRSNSARELMRWLATDPTGTNDPDVLLVGDYNAYAMEDPIRIIKEAGFTDLIASTAANPYSYVFDGQWGYLDHALASSSLVRQITGVADYHINADEPSVLDYNTDFKSPSQQLSLYAANEFRVSDHDPVVVGLCTPPKLSVSVTPNVLRPATHDYRTVEATFSYSADTAAVELVSVISNEPDDGADDGDTVDDVLILDNDSVRLRAERSGSGTGRIYTLTYKATNLCGTSSFATAKVTVPRGR